MLDARRRACLQAMGIDVWVQKKGPGSIFSAEEKIEPAPFVPADPVAGLDWDALQRTVAACRACTLCEGRTQTVFGVGAHDAELMIIGEAPGAEEDRQGEPFVGRAGQLLNAMLGAIGLQRAQVYIANIIKCRPPGNRDPHAEEAAACRPYLLRQIALVQPRLILSVGRISAHNLLGTEESVGRLRGRVHRFEPGDIPLIVTYHPAYLLRKPAEKAKAWQDLQAAWRVLHPAD
jgi:DNA polymerase